MSQLMWTVWRLRRSRVDSEPRRGSRVREIEGDVAFADVLDGVCDLGPGEYRIEVGDVEGGARYMNADWVVVEGDAGERQVRALRWSAPSVAADAAGTAPTASHADGEGPQITSTGEQESRRMQAKVVDSLADICRRIDALQAGVDSERTAQIAERAMRYNRALEEARHRANLATRQDLDALREEQRSMETRISAKQAQILQALSELQHDAAEAASPTVPFVAGAGIAMVAQLAEPLVRSAAASIAALVANGALERPSAADPADGSERTGIATPDVLNRGSATSPAGDSGADIARPDTTILE